MAADEITMIYQKTSDNVKAANKEENKPSIEKLISDNKITDVEDILENEFQKIKTEWNIIYSAKPNHTEAPEILEKLEALMSTIIVIGLLSIKHDKLDILKKVFRTLEKISDSPNEVTDLLTYYLFLPLYCTIVFIILVFMLSKNLMAKRLILYLMNP